MKTPKETFKGERDGKHTKYRKLCGFVITKSQDEGFDEYLSVSVLVVSGCERLQCVTQKK